MLCWNTQWALAALSVSSWWRPCKLLELLWIAAFAQLGAVSDFLVPVKCTNVQQELERDSSEVSYKSEHIKSTDMASMASSNYKFAVNLYLN